VNDDFRELKTRIRKLQAMLEGGGLGDVPLAQAVSAVQRAERRGDRSRRPTPELLGLLEKAELLGRAHGRG
jgi:hypothetical protein